MVQETIFFALGLYSIGRCAIMNYENIRGGYKCEQVMIM